MADERILDKLDLMSQQMARTEANTENLKEYIRAVSSNVKDLKRDLEEHEDDHEAHGAGAANKQSGSIIAWAGVVMGVAALLGPLIAAALK